MFQRFKRGLGVLAALLAPAAMAVQPPEADVVEFGEPVAQASLETQRGGDRSLELNLQDVDAYMQGNKAIGTESGGNHIGGGAFGGASGFPVAVQNTGNNVIIQNAFIIKLDIQ